jgi:hypothetical protein
MNNEQNLNFILRCLKSTGLVTECSLMAFLENEIDKKRDQIMNYLVVNELLRALVALWKYSRF